MRDFFPGLAGVPAAKSTISYVDRLQGVLEYRGIRIEQLAKHSSFLENNLVIAIQGFAYPARASTIYTRYHASSPNQIPYQGPFKMPP